MNKTIRVMQVLQGKASAIRKELAVSKPNSTRSILLQLEAELLDSMIQTHMDELTTQALDIFDMNTTTTYGEGLPF